MQRDVDLIIKELTANVPGVRIEQIRVKHPGADDDGLWFINIDGRKGEVQLLNRRRVVAPCRVTEGIRCCVGAG